MQGAVGTLDPDPMVIVAPASLFRVLTVAQLWVGPRIAERKVLRVTKAEQLESTLSDALAHDGPSLVEISTDAELV